MTNDDFIFEPMTALYPDGTRSVVHLRIGKPFKTACGHHSCIIEAPGIHKPIGIHGEGPIQALHLGLKMVRRHLEIFEARGIKLFWLDTDEPCDWRTCWYGGDNAVQQ